MLAIDNNDFTKSTPRQNARQVNSALQPLREDERLKLSFRSIIGTTTSGRNAFDSHREANRVAYCAGSAVVVLQIQKDLNITQRLYRARPNASATYSTPSFYNPSTPPSSPGVLGRNSPSRTPNGIGGLTNPSTPPNGSPGSSKTQNRTREATCVSIGAKADLIAIGETGYNPRVLIFSTTSTSPSDNPQSLLTDHSFGVDAVAFSTDCRWLCSLGNAYDGFLLLYSVNARTGVARLHSSNKCSNVNDLIWMGNSIVSFGNRHIKVWRVEEPPPTQKVRQSIGPGFRQPASPGPKTLAGRNCILGPLIDASFTVAAAVGESLAMVCSSDGNVCLLDDRHGTQQLQSLCKYDHAVVSIHFDDSNGLLWMANDIGEIGALSINPSGSTDSLVIPNASQLIHVSRPGQTVRAMGAINHSLITIDSKRNVELWETQAGDGAKCSPSKTKRLPAHESAVLGICPVAFQWQGMEQVDFLTYSVQGTCLFWNWLGECQGQVNVLDSPTDSVEGDCGLKTVVAASDASVLVSGSRSGELRLFASGKGTIASAQAHEGDINGIALTRINEMDLVCTCGRDRNIQIFERASDSLHLLQTIEDHSASVTDVTFSDGGTTLISISADRTVTIRKSACDEVGSVAFLSVKMMPLKSSPVSMSPVPFERDALVISTMDRHVHKYEVSSGRLIQSFKFSDPVSNDSVLANSTQAGIIRAGDDSINVLILSSQTDKSIRLHDYATGSLLLREQGQTAISAVQLLRKDRGQPEAQYLVSCGMDGTVAIFDVVCNASPSYPDTPQDTPTRTTSPLKQSMTPNQPLRKTLTKTEIAGFQKALEDSSDGTLTPLRSPSPSRMRQRAARRSLAVLPRADTPEASSLNGSPRALSPIRNAVENVNGNATPKKTAKPRSSLGSRSKSVLNLNDLNFSAEQLCESLRLFRKRMTSAIPEKLRSDLRSDLRQELQMLGEVIGDRETTRQAPSSNGAAIPPALIDDAFDDYLSRMIDQRIALISNAKRGHDVVSDPNVDSHGEQACAGSVDALVDGNLEMPVAADVKISG